MGDLVNFFKIVISLAHRQLYSTFYNKFFDVLNIRTPNRLSTQFEQNIQFLKRFFEGGTSHLLYRFVSEETFFKAEKFEIEESCEEQILKIRYRNGEKCIYWE